MSFESEVEVEKKLVGAARIEAPLKIPDRIAKDMSRVVLTAMLKGDRLACIAAVEKAFELTRKRSGKITKETQVVDVFGAQVSNVLATVGATTIGDVIELTAERLEVQPNCGYKTILKIQQVLVQSGFSLAKSR